MYEAFGALLGHAVVHDVLASGLKTGGASTMRVSL